MPGGQEKRATKEYCLDTNYSTTRLLTKEVPEADIVIDPTYQSMIFLPENQERIAVGGMRTKGCFKRTFSSKPLITIVTVVFNGESTIEDTIASVVNQSYDNIEYIIIDGGSTDKTVDIIKKYDAQIDYWVSEADKGIYYAMNKGISLASGDYVALLNSGDWYDLATCSIVAKYISNCTYDIYYGMLRIYEADKTLLGVKGNTINYIKNEMIAHPTCFVSKKTYLKKRYSTQYNSAADYDFILQLVAERYSFFFIEEVLANFIIGGISSGSHGHVETNEIRYKHNLQSRSSYMLKSIYYKYIL